MNFTSFEFVLFFATVLIARSCLRNAKADKWLLLGASIAFYLSWNVPCVFLIVLTACIDYSIVRRFGCTTHLNARRKLLLLSLAWNLGSLGFFKYGSFFAENLGSILAAFNLHVPSLHYSMILPPGISFYTFASLSYVIDAYYERIPVCTSSRDYSLFLTFFPKLLSGPIVRARELLPQFEQPVRGDTQDIEIGLSYLIIGAVKKLVIADQMAPHINLIFSAPTQYDGLTLLIAASGYAVQIYCDFSGYSDMAIGCARILGFQFPENFQMPYSSKNITEFWRRWHITLSIWFRDYVFLPLEIATRGSSYPTLRVSVNMILTMLLCGLWHGASWTFVVWGGIHGAALAAHKVWTALRPLAAWRRLWGYQPISHFFSHLMTLGVVVLSLVFFRAQSVADALVYLHRTFSWAQDGTRLVSPYVITGVCSVFLVHMLVGKNRNLALELPQMRLVPRVLAYSGMLLVLVVFGATDASAFVYFQF